MSEKQSLKWALELAIEALGYCCLKGMDSQYAQAANMLRDGGPLIEKSMDLRDCSGHKILCAGESFEGDGILRWSEREVIEVVKEQFDPTFEEVRE